MGSKEISKRYLLEKAPKLVSNFSMFSWDASSRAARIKRHLIILVGICLGCHERHSFKDSAVLVDTVGQMNLKGLKLVINIARLFTCFIIQS